MPLTPNERDKLNALLDGMTPASVPGDSVGAMKLDGILSSAERLLHILAQCSDRLLVLLDAVPRGEEPDTSLTGKEPDPPKRRGRPPTKAPEGTTGSPPAQTAAPTVSASVSTPAPSATQGNGAAADPLALPDFLDKSKQGAAPSKDDIFGLPDQAQSEAAVAKIYSNAEAKLVLTAYYDKFGQAKLSQLLESTCKVKRFTDLTEANFMLVCPKAEAELAAAK